MAKYNGTPGPDVWNGTPNADSANGMDGDDELNGLGGDDALVGGAGNDILRGGDGNDTIYAGLDNDYVDGGNDNDSLYGQDGNDEIHGGAGNDFLSGGRGIDILDGGDGDDILRIDVSYFQGSDLEVGDQFIGGAGIDTLIITNGGTTDLDLTGFALGTDIERIQSSGGAVRLTFEQFSNFQQIRGIYRLSGGGTLDLTGGQFVAGAIYLGDAGNTVKLGLNTTFDAIYINGGAGRDVLMGGASNDVLDGGGGNDVINGGLGDDIISGGTGNDVLRGGDGNDTIFDDLGNDVIEGGDGNDTVSLDMENGFSAADRVSGGAGYDTLHISTSPSGEQLVDFNALQIAEDFEDVTVNFGTVVTSVENLNRFDRFSADAVRLTTGGSIVLSDKLQVGRIKLSDFASSVDLRGAGTSYLYDRGVFGGAGDDRIIGNGLDNTLSGGGGNDVIRGGDNGDRISGGAGIDRLFGEAGNDQFNIAIGETVSLGDRYDGGDGFDTVFIDSDLYASELLVVDLASASLVNIEQLSGSAARLTTQQVAQIDSFQLRRIDLANAGSVSFVGKETSIYATLYLSARGNVVQLSDTGFYRVVGGEKNDIVTGGMANDRIAGNGGNDTINGRGGNDSLTGGEGRDTLDGGAGDDMLDGGAGIDHLIGSDGNDTLDGGSANDLLEGGIGNDIYFVDNVGDTVVEALDQGTDLVHSTVTFTLGDNVENLTLDGDAASNGTGNALRNLIEGNGADNILSGGDGNDTLHGNFGNDILNGGAGNDIMDGGWGDDIYYVDSTGDQVSEDFGTGNDLVFSSVSFTLGYGIEAVTLAGNGATRATGNDFSNVLTGNGAANVLDGLGGDDILDGGMGADRLMGGSGSDSYIVDNVGDVVIEGTDPGYDTVLSTVSYTLGANVEALILDGTAAINATGNGLDNLLTGNVAANTLSGGGGVDLLFGGLGNDVLTGGADTDGFFFTTALGAGNIDRITDFASGLDGIVLDLSVFAAIGFEGELSASAFRIGSSAGDSDDRIIYNQTTGALYYDADGSGAGAKIQFATLNAGTVLKASDILAVNAATYLSNVPAPAIAFAPSKSSGVHDRHIAPETLPKIGSPNPIFTLDFAEHDFGDPLPRANHYAVSQMFGTSLPGDHPSSMIAPWELDTVQPLTGDFHGLFDMA